MQEKSTAWISQVRKLERGEEREEDKVQSKWPVRDKPSVQGMVRRKSESC